MPARVRLLGLPVLLCLLAPFCCAQATSARPPATFSMDKDREPMVSLDGLWRFHPGDDPRWADPNFDDSNWPLIRSTEGWSTQGYKNMTGLAWYRVRVAIPEGGEPLSLYIPNVATSYQVFADGEAVGQYGGMPPHERAYRRLPQTFPIPEHVTGHAHEALIAIRVWMWPKVAAYGIGGGLRGGILIGGPYLVSDYSALQADRTEQQSIPEIVLIVLGGMAGLTSLALFVFRPREMEYLWLGAAQLAFIGGIWFFYLWTRSVPTSEFEYKLIGDLRDCAFSLFMIGFYFCLLKARKDWFLWLAVGAFIARGVVNSPAFLAGYLSPTGSNAVECLPFLTYAAWGTFLVTRRAIQGYPDARLVLIPTIGWNLYLLGTATVNTAWVMRLSWSEKLDDIVNYAWQKPFPGDVPSGIQLFFLLAMLAILIRRFARTSRQEDRLASEMESARTVQQVLIPNEIPSIPGFAIEAVYKPASEVGGDFFQIIPTRSGGVLAVIGDVSGKGMPAAMTVSLLVGTFRTLAHYTESPGEILKAMNQRMLARSQGGFTTCLVLRADPDGTFTAANAGHLAPYINNSELALESGLPLGLAADSVYAESVHRLRANEQLTLITDGVVEARGKAGDLLGFDRTAGIAHQSAESIARVAQDFGQIDDITVLALTCYEGAEKTQRAVKIASLAPV